MKIVALCGLGVGTSMMLKMTIEEVLAEEGIKARVDSCDLGSAKTQGADYFVVSRDLESKASALDGEVIFIDNLADEEEVREKLMAEIDQ